MRFAIALEETQDSWELFEKFFDSMTFCPHFILDVFTIQEIEGQEKEIVNLRKNVLKKLEQYKINGVFIVEKGDPVARTAKLIKENKVDILVCGYEHSVFGNTFFESMVKETNIPIMVLR